MLWNADVLMDMVRVEMDERLRSAEQERLARTVVSTWWRRKPTNKNRPAGRSFIVS